MNRDELLTKLAMEATRWPDFKVGEVPGPQEPGIWVTHQREWECFAKGNTNPIRRHDWLDRRAELINEPDDEDAPEWARWKAQDADGDWFWFQFEPERGSDQWGFDCGLDSHCFANDGEYPAGHDWRKTLKPVNQDMSQNKPIKSRNEPHGITGVKHRVDRQLNPATSNLTNSQAREFAEEFKTCSDGQPCGQEDYCDDCPNAPHAQDARRLDEQLRDAINPGHYRQGGIECIDALKAATVGKTGIEAVCVANVIKYLWRYEEKNGVEDVEKALWYLNRLYDELHD